MKKILTYITWEVLFMVVLLLTSAGNYGLNLILGRWLGPASYADVAVVATTVMMFSFIAIGIQMTTTKFISPLYASNKLGEIQVIKSQLRGHSLIGGTFIFLVLCALLPAMTTYLNMEGSLAIFLIFLGIPIQWVISVDRGVLQSSEGFKPLSISYLLEMFTRFIITLVCIVLFSAGISVDEAVALGFLISFIITLFTSLFADFKFSWKKHPAFPQKAIYTFIFIILSYEFGQVIISNADVLLAKHYLDSDKAGLYASLALVGKVVYFGTWTIVMVLFPKVIQRKKQGLSYIELFNKSLSAVIIMGGIIVIACYYWADLFFLHLFGNEYLNAAPWLWVYAFATLLFAIANVFVYYYMSLSKYLPIVLALFFGILQVALVTEFHSNYYHFIVVQVGCMSGLLLSVIIFHIHTELKSKSNAFSHNFSIPSK